MFLLVSDGFLAGSEDGVFQVVPLLINSMHLDFMTDVDKDLAGIVSERCH